MRGPPAPTAGLSGRNGCAGCRLRARARRRECADLRTGPAEARARLCRRAVHGRPAGGPARGRALRGPATRPSAHEARRARRLRARAHAGRGLPRVRGGTSGRSRGRRAQARVIDLRRRGRRPFRIGHRGAAALAPENTIASLALAVELGCDLVELDVIAVDGTLVLAHSPEELPREPATLDEALAFVVTTG